MKTLIMMTFFSLSLTALAEGEKNIRYEYKKVERFDFDEIGVEGEGGSPGDISITPRARNEFKNKIPERHNFNKEMKKAVDGIR